MQNISSKLTGQLWQRLTTLWNRLRDDPRVAQVMSTRIGQYISSHPSLALTLLLFSAMAALPVGVFLTFAIVTVVISVVGFVFFEVFLLSVGGLALLSVLGGIAFFSVLASVVINVFFIAIPSLLRRNYPHLTKRGVNHEKESEGETSGLKEM
ncbi:lipid droplet assembly factor 1-like [Melanotaenia boesemani]|uniref:lipid droplet assembly factor 1-like n=1 Tax=Melanotaenia boesemani TaxID=1250792 RepID=UPI001C05685D|nr:lipid droplet assembly factor 1-like [Melanotaenia boesemani]